MIKNILDKVSNVFLKISSVIICLVALVMVINIITRSAFKTPFAGVMEVVQYGMLICLVLAIGRTGFLNKHVRISLIVDYFSPKVRAIVLFITMLISTIVFAYLAYYYISYIPVSIASNAVTDIFRIPYFFVYIVMATGMLLTALMFLYQALEPLKVFFKQDK